MAEPLTILDMVIKSPKKTIERWSAVDYRDVPNIIQTEYRPGSHRRVWTSAPGIKHSFYSPYNDTHNALLKIDIPKEWYVEHRSENPVYKEKIVKGDYGEQSYRMNENARKYFPVYNGGRVDTFKGPIPNEYIREVCFGEGAKNCFTPEELKKNFVYDDYMKIWDWDPDAEDYRR